MGLFCEILSNEDEAIEIPIPEDYTLHLQQVSIDPKCLREVHASQGSSPITLYIQPAHDEREFAVCTLDPAKYVYNCAVSLELQLEDSPVVLRVEGGGLGVVCALHLLGKWTWTDDSDDFCHSGSAEDNEEDQESQSNIDEDEDEDEDEIPALVPYPETAANNELPKTSSKEAKVEKESSQATKKKRKLDVLNSDADGAGATSSKLISHKKKAPQSNEDIPTNPQQPPKELKPWTVWPEGDEGIPVPKPKTVSKRDGLLVTDFIVGSGPTPKPGSVVKITYEGYFTNGEMFDSKPKKKSPFTFRLGTGQVIPGMDKGIEGMKVGGARELRIPPQLG